MYIEWLSLRGIDSETSRSNWQTFTTGLCCDSLAFIEWLFKSFHNVYVSCFYCDLLHSTPVGQALGGQQLIAVIHQIPLKQQKATSHWLFHHLHLVLLILLWNMWFIMIFILSLTPKKKCAGAEVSRDAAVTHANSPEHHPSSLTRRLGPPQLY